MSNTALSPLINRITQQISTLSEVELQPLQDFVDYLVWKHRAAAEARAVGRLVDVDDATQWITGLEEGQTIDTESLNHWCRCRV
jgi:hypothetical protein